MSDVRPLLIGVPGASANLTAEIAGSKAARLWEMSRLGLPVPPAFVLPTFLCAAANRGDCEVLQAINTSLREGIAQLEKFTGRRFGDSRAPLLVSVRSGAAELMPGMLDTILNVGLNNDSVRGLIRLTGNPRVAWESFRRFIQGYCEVVEGVRRSAFAGRVAEMIRTERVAGIDELHSEALERLAHDFLSVAT